MLVKGPGCTDEELDVDAVPGGRGGWLGIFAELASGGGGRGVGPVKVRVIPNGGAFGMDSSTKREP